MYRIGSWLGAGVLVGMSLGGMAAGGVETENSQVVNLDASPHAALHGVDHSSVQWTSGFWAERYAQNRDVTLRRLWDLLADPEAGHVLENLRIAAGRAEGKYAGTNWQDAWLYKWLEAAACIYRDTKEPWIAERMDEGIALIAQAQQPDGYIATQITAQDKPRWREPQEHEAYVMGHLLTAACVHRRMTGKDSLMGIALRCADYLCDTLGTSVDSGFAHNPTVVMGMVELYRETGAKKYLECAQRVVDDRGHNPKRGPVFNREPGLLGTDLWQDRVPLRNETDVVGHNVFFTYLFAGATDVYLETGDTTLQVALERLWNDLTQRKMSINGGVSPMGHGLSPRNDYVIEAVGAPYFLPNADAYNETCGQIGNLMWNYRMLSIDGEARYADVMETELYNGFLAGIDLSGRDFFYRNTLRRYEVDHIEAGHNDMSRREPPGLRRICCPTNILRTVAEANSYFYSVSSDGLWVHHYGGNLLDCRLADGSRLKLAQETDYPWDGKVLLNIQSVESKKPFSIRMRIPEWCDGATVAVNDQPPDNAEAGYVEVKRSWSAGDSVTINLPMPVRLMQAHPKAEQLRNQVAVMRGPVLYCLESVDLQKDVALDNVYLPSDIRLEPAAQEDMPFGTLALVGVASHRPEPAWEGQLYRTIEPMPMQPIPIRMVPYYAWSNRGAAAMSIWLPVVFKD